MPRILVVDDAAENLRLVELYLRDTEFEVVSAGSGHDAIDACMRLSFELILLDVAMPGIDGFEVCRRLKNDPRTAFVPVIFLTERLIDESEKLAAYQLGAVDYIQKPVDRDELTARIRVMLRLEDARSRLDRENAALRRRLGELQQGFGAASDAIRELQQLRQEWTRAHESAGLLLIDAGMRVVGADEALRPWLGELVLGEQLGARDLTAARLARLLENGARTADLAVAGGSVLHLRVYLLPDGTRAVMVHDLTGVRAAERAIQARELAVAAPPADDATGTPTAYTITEFVGRSPAVLELTERVALLRQTRTTVLIHGETGTGKELVARALHFDGENRSAPFIPLHCGAIAPELVESELFGHEKGAFTGAQQARDGLFRAADGGTIFLDEIAETSPAVQVKLLRVLQRGEIRPVGASQPRIVDVRIIAATNNDLSQLVREGRFREDLYYRLEVVTLHLPPLRERLSDLPLLIEHFLAAANLRHDRLDRPVRGVSRGALERMLGYPWPGNVRELESVIEHAFALGAGDVLQEEDLTPNVLRGVPPLGGAAPVAERPGVRDFRSQLEAAERQAILAALRDCGGDKAAAAQRLRLSRSTFYRRLRELGV